MRKGLNLVGEKDNSPGIEKIGKFGIKRMQRIMKNPVEQTTGMMVLQTGSKIRN